MKIFYGKAGKGKCKFPKVEIVKPFVKITRKEYQALRTCVHELEDAMSDKSSFRKDVSAANRFLKKVYKKFPAWCLISLFAITAFTSSIAHAKPLKINVYSEQGVDTTGVPAIIEMSKQRYAQELGLDVRFRVRLRSVPSRIALYKSFWIWWSGYRNFWTAKLKRKFKNRRGKKTFNIMLLKPLGDGSVGGIAQGICSYGAVYSTGLVFCNYEDTITCENIFSHEIAHILGAHHTEDDSVMSSHISPTEQVYFPFLEFSKQEIYQCLGM